MVRKVCKISLISLALIIMTSLGGRYADAHEPDAVGWRLAEVSMPPRFGSFFDQVEINLFGSTDESKKMNLLVLFRGCEEDPKIGGRPVLNLDELIAKKGASPRYNSDWKDPGPRWKACPGKAPAGAEVAAAAPGYGAAFIPAGNSATVNISVEFLREANEGMRVQLEGDVFLVSDEDLKEAGEDPNALALLMRGRQPASYLSVSLFYRLAEEGKWAFDTFARIFGEPSEGYYRMPQTGKYIPEMHPVSVEGFWSTLSLPRDKKDDGGARFKKTLEAIFAKGSRQAGDFNCYKENINPGEPKPQAAVNDTSSSLAASTYNLTGKFSSKWAGDHTLHPGFGWRVQAWTKVGAIWKFLGSNWVRSNGTWSVVVPSSAGYTGAHLRVKYLAYNNYYEIKAQSGSRYAWRDPDQYSIPTNFYAGHRYADTDGGSANGVGDLYDGAMRMWSRLYWKAGINPVPASSPIQVHFPNTWYNCGGSSPWSCANTSGDIWLIASHGIKASVVTHEFAHQLNFKFWNNKLPANSGGSHSLNGCYSTRLGMALTEGFADFIPGWVGYQNRNVAESGFSSGQWNLGYDLETRWSPPNCGNGWENEIWVSRVFWDLHDTRTDGSDILWFTHKGAVISLYLANGPASNGAALDMTDFETIYRNAASSGHEGFITDIFEQNRH